MSKPPKHIMQQMRNVLFRFAEEANWNELTDAEKNALYATWTNDPKIGGMLSAYVGVGGVKTYLKDAVLKVYVRRSRADHKMPLVKLGLDTSMKVIKRYEKPHGVLLSDGKLVCWGRAKQWKIVLMALHERSFVDIDAISFGAVFIESADGFGDSNPRKVAESAAIKLGIRKLVWV